MNSIIASVTALLLLVIAFAIAILLISNTPQNSERQSPLRRFRHPPQAAVSAADDTLFSTQNSAAANTIALIVQKFVGNAENDNLNTFVPPPLSDFNAFEPGSYSYEDDGWFFRTYNDVGYLHWKHISNNNDENLFSLDSIGSGIADMARDGNNDEREFIRIEYGAMQSEEWGGFVDIGRILLDRNSNSTQHDAKAAGEEYLGYAANLYNCGDTTHIRLGYRIVIPQSLPGRAHLRLILLDGSDCSYSSEENHDHCAAPPGQNLENWYSFNYLLDNNNSKNQESNNQEWQELILPWSAFERPGWTGQVGNDQLDLDGIRGWRLEISIDSQGEVMNSMSEGVIDIDTLSCVGFEDDGKSIIDAPFRLEQNFTEAIASGVWSERHYQSSISRNLSSAYILPDTSTMVINYTVERTEDWGGFVDYSHISPGYYNLSSAEAISLDYEVIQPASEKGRAHLRLILLDGSDCLLDDECDAYPGQGLENYYSFHYILDDTAGTDGDEDVVFSSRRGTIKVPLIGSASSDSPFWRTGWTGPIGNDILDKDSIRGFRLEINLDSQGEIGTLASGMLAVGNLTAIFPEDAVESVVDVDNIDGSGIIESEYQHPTLPEAKCVVEPDLHFSVDSTVWYSRIEFVGSRCCDICMEDPKCLFAHNTGKDCYLSSGLDSVVVNLAYSEPIRLTTASYWMDDPLKRGDFCSACSCEEESGTINCKGQNLTIAPKSFDQGWSPRVLDLRENPSLMILGEDTFESIASTLQKIYLPKELMYISPKAFMGVSESAILDYEGDGHKIDPSYVDQNTALLNVIRNKTHSFGDVCCSLSVATGPGGLSYCDLEVFVPGIDSVYAPFIQYFGAYKLREIRPSSSFLSEASESPEMCAEYCAFDSKCRYFSYDARWKQSEHRCYLLGNNGTSSQKLCCDPDDYGDQVGTLPGGTSGWTPRTRHEEYGARVNFGPKQLEASESNNFETS